MSSWISYSHLTNCKRFDKLWYRSWLASPCKWGNRAVLWTDFFFYVACWQASRGCCHYVDDKIMQWRFCDGCHPPPPGRRLNQRDWTRKSRHSSVYFLAAGAQRHCLRALCLVNRQYRMTNALPKLDEALDGCSDPQRPGSTRSSISSFDIFG